MKHGESIYKPRYYWIKVNLIRRLYRKTPYNFFHWSCYFLYILQKQMEIQSWKRSFICLQVGRFWKFLSKSNLHSILLILPVAGLHWYRDFLKSKANLLNESTKVTPATLDYLVKKAILGLRFRIYKWNILNYFYNKNWLTWQPLNALFYR